MKEELGWGAARYECVRASPAARRKRTLPDIKMRRAAGDALTHIHVMSLVDAVFFSK
jgi:hypothetical protein